MKKYTNRLFAGLLAGTLSLSFIGCTEQHHQKTIANAPDYTADHFQALFDHLKEREGFKLTVYPDSEGHPTVGYGHLVRPEDNLKIGDIITYDQALDFLAEDLHKALKAARNQCDMLEIQEDPDFVNALTCVNFQLGSGWYKKHKRTWAYMRQHRWEEAAIEVADSKWYIQTPRRVEDFQDTLRNLTNLPYIPQADMNLSLDG